MTLTPEDLASLRERVGESEPGEPILIIHEFGAAILNHIDSLTELNRNLSNQLVGMSDRLQESAKQIAAKAWDEGFEAGEDHGDWSAAPVRDEPMHPNPYRT